MKAFSVIIFVALVIQLPGCVYAVRVDGPYEGRVVDADTGKPIEGVVILGTWYTAQFSPAGSTHDFYDAKETVTDKKGDFSIQGRGLKVLSNLEPMHILIFKAGYEYLNVPWISLKKDILLKEKIKWEGNKPIIPLRRLTAEERKESHTFPPYPPSGAPKEEVKLMMEEIYRERKARGLD